MVSHGDRPTKMHDEQAVKQVDGQMGRQMNRWTDEYAEKCVYEWADRWTHRLEGQADEQIDM